MTEVQFPLDVEDPVGGTCAREADQGFETSLVGRLAHALIDLGAAGELFANLVDVFACRPSRLSR